MEDLKTMYKIYSPSKYEYRLSDYVQGRLDSLGIKYKTRENMVFCFRPDTPLVCAHLDQVADMPITRVKEKNGIIYADGNLGADDKNGVWIALQLIARFPNISFIFSTQEEIGGNLSEILFDHAPVLDRIKYGLLFDRCGGKDIVCYANDYGTKRFQTALQKVGKKYGYKPTRGIWSDADALSEHISCANLSCGYYKAHTDREYTKVGELLNALQYGINIIKALSTQKRFGPVPPWQTYTTVKSIGAKKKTGKKSKTSKKIKKDSYGVYYEEPDHEVYYYCPACDDYVTAPDYLADETCELCGGRLLVSDARKFYR